MSPNRRNLVIVVGAAVVLAVVLFLVSPRGTPPGAPSPTPSASAATTARTSDQPSDGPSGEPSDEPSQEPVALTVGLGFIPSVQFAPFYLADQAGYYEEAGLDVTFQNKIDPDLVRSSGRARSTSGWPTGPASSRR